MLSPKQVPLQSVGVAIASMQSLQAPVNPIGADVSPGQFVRLSPGNNPVFPQNPMFVKLVEAVGPQMITLVENGLFSKKESRTETIVAPFAITITPWLAVDKVVRLLCTK